METPVHEIFLMFLFPFHIEPSANHIISLWILLREVFETKDLKILRELLTTPSVSGNEGDLRALIRGYIKPYVDEMRVDALGNLIAVKKGEGKRKIMIDAHMDEIGFLVSSVDEEGLVRLTPVGGVFVPYTIAQEVQILGEEPILGVVQGIRRKRGEEEKFPQLESLYVDIGAKDKKEAEKYVREGQVACYNQTFKEICGGKIMGTGLDNRSSVFLLIEAIKEVEAGKNDLYFVFASQEEVGLRGSLVAAYSINPEAAIVLDVTYAWYPPFEKHEVPVELGKGPAIAVAPNIDGKVLSAILRAAEREKVERQTEVAGRWTGTDTDYICISREGVRCGLISIPLRYMHSPREVVSLKDLENTLKLLKGTLQELEEVDLN